MAAIYHSNLDVTTSRRLKLKIMHKLKSFTSLCPCRKLPCILFFLISSFFSVNCIVANYKYKQIIHDLPAKTDLDFYLDVLEKAVNFGVKHKLYVDLNLQFGLFLVDVNLKSYIQQKRYIIPAKTYLRLEQLLLKIDVLANYFHSMVEKNKNVKEYRQDLKITQLFYNTTTWPRPPEILNTHLLNKTKIYGPVQLRKIYGKWENYYNSVNDYDKYKPSPKESDKCIESLANTPPLSSPADCHTSLSCKNGVQKGSEFGYGLSHRMLFMAIARFSRMCIVFSENEDKRMTDKFCKRSFNEAQFIAINKFQLPDLMYEHIALCGLFGHAQFFRNSWLKKLLRFQTPEGCFSDTIAPGKFGGHQMRQGNDDKWHIANSMYIMNGQCNGHFTAVAAATLSQALRYIIETHY